MSALLIAGGLKDPNLASVATAAKRHGHRVVDLRCDVNTSPSFSWNVGSPVLRIDGCQVAVHGAFVRHDVFAPMADSRPESATRAVAWYQATTGFLLSQPAVNLLNRDVVLVAANKPAQLAAAAQCGLRIPETVITNDTAGLSALRSHGIAKPVGGGGFCRPLDEAIAAAGADDRPAAAPAIVQRRLLAPEVRIYVVGNRSVAFDVRSSSLDYRERQDADVRLLDRVLPEVSHLRRLMSLLHMDFGAADFKTDPESGALTFLELNTSPMFARFDDIAGGSISDAIVERLMRGAATSDDDASPRYRFDDQTDERARRNVAARP